MAVFQLIMFEFIILTFSLLLREYSELAVNVLTRSAKISYLIQKNFFKLNLAQNEEKIGQECFSADFRSFRDSLTASLPEDFQKQSL